MAGRFTNELLFLVGVRRLIMSDWQSSYLVTMSRFLII